MIVVNIHDCQTKRRSFRLAMWGSVRSEEYCLHDPNPHASMKIFSKCVSVWLNCHG